MSCAEYATQRPQAGWVQLDHCIFHIAPAVSHGRAGKIDALYLPILPVDAPVDALAVLVLKTEDPELLALFERILAVDSASEPDPDTIAELTAGPIAAVTREREIRGLVQDQLDLDDDARARIAAELTHIAPDFAVVAADQEPKLALHAGATGLGLAAAIAAVALAGRTRK